MNPFLPILILLLGAAVMAMGVFVPNSRRGAMGLVPVIAVILAAFAGLALGLRVPSEVTLSTWPAPLFNSSLKLIGDRVSWLFQLALLLLALTVHLTGLSRPGGPRLGARTAGLLITAAALAAVQSEDLLTLALTWAVFDAVYFLSWVLLTSGENIESQATLSLTFNVLATFCVMAAALDGLRSEQTGFVLGSTPLSDRATLLLWVAVIFRSGVFPFDQARSSDVIVRPGLGSLLRLAPAALAFDLLTHLAMASAGESPLKPWLTAAACLGLLLGAAQLWQTAEPRSGIRHAVLAQSSLVILAALWGGAAAGSAVLALGLATLAGAAALFLSNGYSETARWWTLSSILGVVVLAGSPLTVGFVGMAGMYAGFLSAGGWLVFVIAALGQVILTAAYIRLALWPGEPVPAAEPIVGVAYLFGLAAPLTLALIGGFAAVGLSRVGNAPPFSLFSAASLPALGAVVVAGLGGLAAWRFESVIRIQAQSTWSTVAQVARLGWLYSSFWEAYRLVGRVLRTTADIVEGEGGVLWTIVAVLLVWLLFRGS
jgi:hypothetical protein